jgi:hypothetical protein
MRPTAVPSRITIDFRDAATPSRTWILGAHEDAPGGIQLVPSDGPGQPAPQSPTPLALAAVLADCACPDFCERDHANE